MESLTIKIVFKYLHFADTVFQHLSLLHPPSSHLHLCLSSHVPLHLLAEITHPEQPPTLRKKSVMKLLSSFDSAVSLHNKESLVFSLIEPSNSSDGNFNCLFQSLFDYRQFPFNYDILTANFNCPERRERCKNYTRLLQKIELTHFPVLGKVAPSIKLAVRQARDSEASWWEDVMSWSYW